jgi:uracil phosphoribosyltransferase
VLEHYRKHVPGKPARVITLNLIITPEYLRALRALRVQHPEVTIYAHRLDRGLSAPEVLATVPGTFWDRERGLNDHGYIIPGGGGFGEIMNNAFV